MRTLHWISAVAFIVSSGVLSGQTPMKLTIDQAVDIGLTNSTALHSSKMKVEGADAKASETGTARFPVIKFNGAYTRLSEVTPFIIGPFAPLLPTAINLAPNIADNYNLRLTLQQPIFTGFKISSAADAASYTAEAVGHDYARDKAELIYAIKNAYWSYYKAIEFKKVIDEVVGQMNAHLRDVQSMFSQGLVTKNEVLKVEVQLSNAEVTQIDAKNNVQLAMLNLDNTICLPLTTTIELQSTIEKKPMLYDDPSHLVEQALDRRPEVKAMDLRIKAGESGVTLARSGWWPQIALVGNYYYSRPNQRIVPVLDVFKNTWDVSLNVSLDIWNWGATIHQTTQAQAQLAQARDAMSQLRDGISLEVTQSFLSFHESEERITVAEKGVGQAEENARITNEKFTSGLVLNTDVLDAEVALLQAKWNYIQALVDHELAGARLQKAIAADQQSSNQ